MVQFRMICPECGATVIMASPEALIWERCPGCRLHVWDLYDQLMADIYTPPKQEVTAACVPRA